jgi:NAD(P)H-dependent FMN reductase
MWGTPGMKIVAISGSYRKGRTIDTLIDKALEGVRAMDSKAEIEKIHLIDRNIKFCTNCHACYNDDPSKPYAHCVIKDDMQEIYPLLDAADGYVLGTPVNMGHVTALMKAFLERICWVFARPGRFPIKGCPEPRSARKRRVIIIVSSGVVPPLLRRWCDAATPLLSETCRDCFNASIMGTLYAGAVRKWGIQGYFKKAYRLGEYLML